MLSGFAYIGCRFKTVQQNLYRNLATVCPKVVKFTLTVRNRKVAFNLALLNFQERKMSSEPSHSC